MNNLIYYKYQDKEISTPHNEGYLTNFTKTKDWIEWLQKEFEFSKEDFKTKQFDLLFKNDTTQLEWRKLFYTEEEIKKMEWGISDHKQFKGLIGWPPIYLHPLIEDIILLSCSKCGNKQSYDNRELHQYFQKEKENCYDWEKEDNVCLVKCEKCGFVGGIYKKCSYRICEDHGNQKTSAWWRNAWKKLGVNPDPDKFKEKSEIERLLELEKQSRSHE